MVWLPERVAAELLGQSSLDIYGLAAARLYIQSLRGKERREGSKYPWRQLGTCLVARSFYTS